MGWNSIERRLVNSRHCRWQRYHSPTPCHRGTSKSSYINYMPEKRAVGWRHSHSIANGFLLGNVRGAVTNENKRFLLFRVHRPMTFATDSETNLKLGDTIEILQTLAQRLRRPTPLRFRVSSSAAELPNDADQTVSEAWRQLGRLANSFVHGYSKLPTLRLSSLLDGIGNNVQCERIQIVSYLACECGPSTDAVYHAVRSYEKHGALHVEGNATPRDAVVALTKLRKASSPAYEELLEFILKQNTADGMKFLVSLREDLMIFHNYLKHQNSTQEGNAAQLSQMQDLDLYLQSVFQIWFAPGLLELRRITYDQTAASIIEIISVKEAVHPLKSLHDIRSRLGPKRRVFALFHPLLPGEPLVFVHIALIERQQEEKNGPTSIIPSSMNDVMDLGKQVHASMNPKEVFSPMVATFYSISTGVKGLGGVGLGEILLKLAIKALKTELPSIEIFVTLSPIPKFRKWLQVKLTQHNDESLLSLDDRKALVEYGMVQPCVDGSFPWENFWKSLENEDFAQSISDSTRPEAKMLVLRGILSKLACRYLAVEKHRGKPLDGVCKFHVGNGAEIFDVHFGADLSRIGMKNSFGLMCNYLYNLERLEENIANFEANYDVPLSQNIRRCLEDIK